jgi:hypothetical protein
MGFGSPEILVAAAIGSGSARFVVESLEPPGKKAFEE